MNFERLSGMACVITFAVTALTSMLLFINYIAGVSPRHPLIVDLHVWFGLAFIVIAATRMGKNRAFMERVGKR